MTKDIAHAYELLGVSPDVSDKEMRSAWRKLVRTYHPDLARTDPEEASRRMGEINAAYDAVAHHRLKQDKKTASSTRRQTRSEKPHKAQRTARPQADTRRAQRTESAQSEKKQERAHEAKPKRRTYRSPKEQSLINAACAVFEDTRRSLNAAARQPVFLAFR